MSKARGGWRPAKRRKDPDDESGIEMTELFREALTLRPSETCTFDMDSTLDKRHLAAALWTSQPLLGETSLSAANGLCAGGDHTEHLPSGCRS